MHVFAQQAEKNAGALTSKSTFDKSTTINAFIDTTEIYIVEKRTLSQYAMPKVTISNINSVSIQDTKSYNNMPTSYEPKVSIGIERKQAVAYILIPQFIKKADGSYEKLTNYSLQITEQDKLAQKTTGARVYVPNSVLASGSWYKIALSTQGVYKVDYNFIKNSIGVDLSGTPSANIKLYGNGGEMLAEDNAVFRNDDLFENAIEMHDGGDGVFNPGDYFLFYANGPHTITKDSINKRFSHQFNVYNNVSYYFLNFENGQGKRIQTAANPNTSNVNVTSYNDFYFYEKDSTSPSKFGKVWWGDEFNDQPGRYLNRTYSLLFSDADLTSSAFVRTRVGAISTSGSSTMNVNLNGLNIQSINLASIGLSFSDPVLRVSDLTTETAITNAALNLNFSFVKGSSSAYAYLDFFEVNLRRNLNYNGYLRFADWNSVGAGNVASYTIQNANANTVIWDVSNSLLPVKMNASLSGSVLTFNQDASSLHTFVATDGNVASTPSFVEKVTNQNLHNSATVDYIVITQPSFKSEADRLSAYHKSKRGYNTIVVTPQQIYNEFASGSQDVSALRDFIKMYYDKGSINTIPKYVLMMGDASYDYKDRINGNTNFVPVYETYESVNKTSGYCTDDFFGFLDDIENINNYNFNHTNTLDIGIGRIPISSLNKATDVVNKIIHYDSPMSFGPWKNNMSFNADDGDGATHLDDAEIMSNYIKDSLPVYNNYKIYVDGYVQQSTPAGPRTPDANKAVVANLYNGTFLMNYNGHGGPLGWCEERIFSMDDVNYLTNLSKLPLFITATCDFAPFDNPAINSAGEILLTKSDGGAIALMTTTQLVYADQNRIMNLNYMKSGFRPLADGTNPTLGDAFRMSKNLRYVASVDEYTASNFRKFALLGDPALPLAFPKHRVFTDSINGVSVIGNIANDTLKALGKYTISGHIQDVQGNILTNYNGIVYPTIYDKAKKLSTLQNDGDSPLREYEIQNSAIYKGKATVKNGKFSFTFVVPKDINYAVDLGKISYYANNETEDANGFDKSIYIGSSSTSANSDNAGPIIKPYMNNEKFVNGGIVKSNSTLLLKLYDDNGINYTGNSIGHDITAVLDGNVQNTYVLNNFFEAELDNYQSGTVRFPVNNIAEGLHTFTIKAWDVYNNSTEVKLDFNVVNSTEGNLAHVYNYPNPFSTRTNFMFEHNMPNENLYVTINIFSITGKIVKSIKTMVNTPGTRVDDIEWDGRDAFGEKLGNGVYLYKLSVKSASGFSDGKLQKLILMH